MLAIWVPPTRWPPSPAGSRELHWQTAQASETSWVGHHSRLFQLIPTSCMYSGPPPPAVHFRATDPPPATTLHFGAHTFTESVQPQEGALTTPRPFTGACGPGSSPVSCHWPRLPCTVARRRERSHAHWPPGLPQLRVLPTAGPSSCFVAWVSEVHMCLQPAPATTRAPAAGPSQQSAGTPLALATTAAWPGPCHWTLRHCWGPQQP